MKCKLDINWKEYLGEEDIEDMWSKFRIRVDEAIKECVPAKEVWTSRKRTNKELLMNQNTVVKNQKKKSVLSKTQTIDEV